jgi:hypothetical protein
MSQNLRTTAVSFFEVMVNIASWQSHQGKNCSNLWITTNEAEK